MTKACDSRAAGRRDEAQVSLRTAEDLGLLNEGQYFPSLIYVYGQLGLEDDARRMFDRYRGWAETHAVGAGDWVAIYLGLGDADAAYEWFTRAIERARGHDIDAGFLSLMALKANVQQDLVLDQPRFLRLRERLQAVALSP